MIDTKAFLTKHTDCHTISLDNLVFVFEVCVSASVEILKARGIPKIWQESSLTFFFC